MISDQSPRPHGPALALPGVILVTVAASRPAAQTRTPS